MADVIDDDDEEAAYADFMEMKREWEEAQAKNAQGGKAMKPPKKRAANPLPSALTRLGFYSTGGRGRGNRTKGDKRRGNRNGRPPAYAGSVMVWRILINLTDEDVSTAMYIGEGEISRGIRRLLSAARSHFQPDLPLSNRDDMQGFIRVWAPNVSYAVTRILAAMVKPKPAPPKPAAPPPDPADDWDDV